MALDVPPCDAGVWLRYIAPLGGCLPAVILGVFAAYRGVLLEVCWAWCPGEGGPLFAEPKTFEVCALCSADLCVCPLYGYAPISGCARRLSRLKKCVAVFPPAKVGFRAPEFGLPRV